MAEVTIYHNPKCSSSRTALGELQARDVDLEIVQYLKTPLDRAGLEQLLDMLDAPAADLVRHDARFKELGLDPADYTDRKAVVALLVEYPELMQRPILVRDGRAVIARPAADVVAAFMDPSRPTRIRDGSAPRMVPPQGSWRPRTRWRGVSSAWSEVIGATALDDASKLVDRLSLT